MNSNDALPRPASALWIFAFYLIVMGLIAFVTRDAPSEPDVWTWTVDKLIHQGIDRMGDPTSFAIAAVDVYETGWIRQENNWIFNLWPPGLPLVEAGILVVFGKDAPILFVLLCLAALLHATVAFALYCTLRRYIGGTLAAFGGLVPFAFPVMRVYLLQPTGVALGETFAAGFFALGMLASISAMRRSSYMLGILAGLSLAMAAYFRSQFEFILLVQALATGVVLLLALSGILKKLLSKDIPKGRLICLAMIIVSSQVSMLPWRIYHLAHEGTTKWVLTTDLIIRNSVKSDAELDAVGGNFVVRGGGNVVCHLNPEACDNEDQARSNFFRTFFEQPIDWLNYKVHLFPAYWFAPPGNWTDVIAEPERIDLICNATFAGFIFISFVLAFLARPIRNDSAWIVLALFNITFWAAYAAILVFAHFEVRYLYFPKFIGTVLFLIQMAMLFGNRSARKAGEA